MKNRTGLIILAILCLALGFATIYTKRQATEQRKADTETILTLSNKWTDTTMKWEDQKQVSAELEGDLKKTRTAYSDLSNTLVQVTDSLERTSASLKNTQTKLTATEAEVKQRDARIAELESANQELDKRAADLSLSITNLTMQISETKRRLAASEGDKAFLEKELKRLMGEKAELERQFNDIVVLRAQVAKLKEELNIARRVEWIRKGLFATSDQKGAQKLMQGATAPQQTAPKQNYDLNVEVTSDGTARVVPPTNPPPATAK